MKGLCPGSELELCPEWTEEWGDEKSAPVRGDSERAGGGTGWVRAAQLRMQNRARGGFPAARVEEVSI